MADILRSENRSAASDFRSKNRTEKTKHKNNEQPVDKKNRICYDWSSERRNNRHKIGGNPSNYNVDAGMAELADAQASGACGSNIVWVQVPLPASFFMPRIGVGCLKF